MNTWAVALKAKGCAEGFVRDLDFGGKRKIQPPGLKWLKPGLQETGWFLMESQPGKASGFSSLECMSQFLRKKVRAMPPLSFWP